MMSSSLLDAGYRKDVVNPTQDSYRGALVGAAIGDALGSTVDEMSRQAIREKYGVHRELVGGGRLKLKAGQTADDTVLILTVAKSLAEKGEVDVRDIVKRMAEWFNSNGKGKGLGPTTRTVLSGLKPKAKDVFAGARKVWEHNKDTCGGGCLARVAPIGMLRRVQFKELITDTINVCKITHFDQRSVDACIAFNFGVSYLTSGKDPSKLLFKTWRFLMDARSSREYKDTVSEDEPKKDMVKGLKAVNDVQYDDLKPSGDAIDMTQAAYWLTLNAIDFEEGLVRAVNLGGDASTLGAVAGALVGARFGEHAIPERWLEAIQGRVELEAVADKICRLGEPKK
jgi:ADP-ribosyl-[dinitrogen reductase] hydrolase